MAVSEVNQDITQLIFSVPHFFNKTSLNILDYSYTTIHDYVAAAAYLYDLQRNSNSYYELHPGSRKELDGEIRRKR